MGKIPFHIITGFLGSGKTTFLKNILNEYSEKVKIGIIQNEFAAANVDSVDLKSTGKNFEIFEINKGSVFCICLFNDFIHSLNDFIEKFNPEIIFLEATGLADPAAISELLDSPTLKDKVYVSKVYTIVDAINFDKLKFNNRVISQIRIADEIIINKIDSNEVNVNDINQQIEALNPFAKINWASYCNIDLEGLLTDDEKVSRIYSGSESAFQFSERPEIESKVLRTNRRFNSKYISDLLNKVGSDVHRLKGYLRTEDNLNISIQFVFGKYSISELNNYSGPNLLVALGDKGAISPLFKSILSLAL